MPRPKLFTLQSRLLAYFIATCSCLALWMSLTPHHLAYAAEVPTAPDYDPLNRPTLHELTNGELPHIEDANLEGAESGGYAPDFAYLDRSLIGRQAAEVDQLANNEKMEKDIDPGQTLHFVFKEKQLRLRRAVAVPSEALEAPGTDNASGNAEYGGLVQAESDGSTHDEEAGSELRKRQEGSRVWLTANTCRQPMPNENLSTLSKNHPQLVMHVSTSPKNQKPGPDSTKDTLTNITGILFDSGYASFELNATSDVYIGIAAPELEEDWFGSWHFELAASVDGPYHNYNDSDPFLLMIDTDSESALFITYNLSESNKTEEVDKWREQNPFNMYAFAAGDSTPITGMEHSYCALQEQFNANTTKNFTIATSITTKFSVNDFPKTQFHVQGLDAAKTYNGFVVVQGSQEPVEIPRVGTVRGGGRVFQAFNWTTKADDSCQVLFDLDFCDSVAYAVPSNKRYKFNDTALAELYDNQARDYYNNFTKSLAQVACDTTSQAQYSLARTCADCEKDYKNWLCLVLIPRCENYAADDDWLQPRNINMPFPNGTLPFDNNVTAAFNETYRNRFAYSQSRNPLIDDVIQPGPYKEMKPCEDLCFDIVRSCPAQLGFACPNFPGKDGAYGRREAPDTLTCSFPGAVVKLNVVSGARALGRRIGMVVLGAVVVVVGVWF
ncbi:calcium channel subunit Mid1 [Clathrospora elynae]|uniref:Calcium channel subunit Mid1 n=1 Tax=Clathrospora elynae TaxID=706981 RepID=A0A6A5SEJ3_9PLEO|nr:calcium channel subunit Mid1 [Clathrospora elynae]